jgi:hypothetical protein
MKSKWVYIGSCGVDSGQLMITDPCYVKDFVNNNMQDKRVFTVTATGKRYKLWQNFKNFEEVIHDGKTMNQLIAEGKVVETLEPGLDNTYSYSGACDQTLYDKRGGGTLFNGIGAEMGVAVRTADGDGCYPVFVKHDTDGAVKEVLVKFR